MIIRNLDELDQIAAKIAAKIKTYDVIILDGNLGAGKTQFTKFLGRHLGITQEIVSPTYQLVNSYKGHITLHHFDVYRLNTIEELYQIGFSEYLNQEAVVIVEWGSKFKDALPDTSIFIEINVLSDQTREFTTSDPSVTK